MNALALSESVTAQQYKEFYMSTDTNMLYELSPISKILHIPQRPVGPIKSKHQTACERTFLNMYEKYKHKGGFEYYQGTHWQIKQANEKVLRWNTSKIVLYIIEIQTRYKHYSPKYDEYLYEFCCTFLKLYYGKKDANRKIIETKQQIFNNNSGNSLNKRVTKYIKSLPELKWLHSIYSGTCSISKERFILRKEYTLA